MAKLSLYARKGVISLKSAENSNKKIQEVLLEEGINTSITAISLFLSRYRKTGRLNDARRSGRKPKLRQEHVDYMDEKMKENDELTSRELKEKVAKDCDMDVSTATIRRARRKLGWKKENARYCQFVREPNKMKRLAFCLKALREKEKFENIIFTDETSVQIEQHARICFRKDGSQPKRKGRPKHPLKVRISLNVMLGSLSFSINYV
ncbi:Transposable element Tcb2 transposase [Paramuricea clavata]|uniref:Transposable element Tcb2 transposase n=1 Tax=Paramuricea clavata TaxID=317549 RepID=A0A7D9J7X5_PARCT|nr:Transposable element Tcb2 transposase [Paramuricea clavata]